MIITHKVHARIGLLGNPSDGYFGKTIACTIRNFGARVQLWESPSLVVVPNPRHDPTTFRSLSDLAATAGRDGYYGGLRLLFAVCKKFHEACSGMGIKLPHRNFTITYETDIPRQVGLGGSSAIISAAFKCLMEFYDLSAEDIPLPVQPNIVLKAETEELEIAAGLQDRVVQVYGGTVYMDFNAAYMAEQGHGLYERIDSRKLPPLFLAYVKDPSFSGKVHSDLRFRYQRGEKQVLAAIKSWAGLAQRGRRAIQNQDFAALDALIDRNFDLRRKVLGDAVIGAHNLRLVEIAREHGRPAKFSGSGGAVVGTYEDSSQLRKLQQAFTAEGYDCVAVDPE